MKELKPLVYAVMEGLFKRTLHVKKFKVWKTHVGLLSFNVFLKFPFFSCFL